MVAVSGTYFATDVDAHCSSYTDLVSGKTIVFKDAAGTVIGTATTTELVDVENVVGGHASPIPETYGACREWAEYTVQLPEEDFYQAEVDGQVVGTISRQELESKGRFDLETPPAFRQAVDAATEGRLYV